MKRLNHLEQLDEHLRKMPKPNLNKQTELQIKRTILNTRTSKAKQKRKLNFKGITATVGALAAAFLFAVLIYGTLGEEPQPTTLLLSSFVNDEITKINGTMEDESYLSEEETIINLFYETIGETEFIETDSEKAEFTEILEVYDDKDVLLETFQFSDSNIVMIDGKHYKFDSSKWEDFKEMFFTDNYLVGEDAEDVQEEPPEETANVEDLLNEEIAKAPSERDWDKILEYIRQGASSDRALHLAAKENLDTIVEQLLQRGANPNSLDANQNTPLTLTTSTRVASLLINSGADIEHRNARNYNALVQAVYGHQTEMVKLLLESGADPNTTITPDNEFTVLWMAVKFDNQQIRDLLIQHGANLVDENEYASWIATEIPKLEEMINEDLLYYASIGRLPNLDTIQLPADPSALQGQHGKAFESFAVEGGTADVYGEHIFIKPEGQELYTAYQFEINPGDHVTVLDIENVLGQPSSTFMNEVNGKRYISYSLERYELRFSFDGTVTYPKDETVINTLELVYKQPGIAEHAETIFNLIADKNMTELAKHVHPEKGVLISPFLQLKSRPWSEEIDPITFPADNIPSLLEDTTEYRWGYHGGSGLPIDMTPAEFFEDYVYTKQGPDALYVNQQTLNGPEFFTDYVRKDFPDAHMVQYTFNETVPGDDLSWVQLTLIFEPYNDEWKLVGILHNAWTP
ncbi:ankyrin repeat domain-containing protein [Ornithinibacillus sp. 179-J 7C1 HS]|uniref:ankyrin repeat domain-containing protein n=1 Tax=Ornithinibacillus sp. 179-J 7C1 HS TaxID=3142384 RepID=UPI00399F8A7C